MADPEKTGELVELVAPWSAEPIGDEWDSPAYDAFWHPIEEGFRKKVEKLQCEGKTVVIVTQTPVVVDGENLVGMSTNDLKERVFQRLVSDPLLWNGAHAMHPETAGKQMEELAKGGRQGMIEFLQGVEQRRMG